MSLRCSRALEAGNYNNCELEMEWSEESDYVYCTHCKENVVRSTYWRHQQLLQRKRKLVTTTKRPASDSDSSEFSSDEDSTDTSDSSSGLPCNEHGK